MGRKTCPSPLMVSGTMFARFAPRSRCPIALITGRRAAVRCIAVPENLPTDALAPLAGSHPNDASARRLGKFLTMAQLQCSCASSAMFLTGAAQNFLCVKLAAEMGVPLPDTFITWLKGADPPTLLHALLPGSHGPAVLGRIDQHGVASRPSKSINVAEMSPLQRTDVIYPRLTLS